MTKSYKQCPICNQIGTEEYNEIYDKCCNCGQLIIKVIENAS